MNALALDPLVPARMGAAGLLRAYLAEARYECLRLLRAPGFAIPFLVLPVAIYLLFGVAMSAGAIAKDPRLADVLFTGFSTMAIMGPAMFGLGVTLASEREAGLLKLKRALPVPPGGYLLSKFLMALFFAAVAMVLMITTALLVGRITLSAGQLIAVAAVLIPGSLPFCAIGLMVGAWFSGGTAPAIVNLIYLPMIWLSGLFVPLPEFLRKLVVIWPAFHLDQLALAAGGVRGFVFMPPLSAAAVLVAVTLVCGGAAIRRLARVG